MNIIHFVFFFLADFNVRLLHLFIFVLHLVCVHIDHTIYCTTYVDMLTLHIKIVFILSAIISFTCDVMNSDRGVKEKYAKHQTSLHLWICVCMSVAFNFLFFIFTSKQHCCCFRLKFGLFYSDNNFLKAM